MARSFSLRNPPKRLIDATSMQPWVSGLLHIFGNELSNRRWVFIIGCYNSGTTLLAELLQTHSDLDGLRNEGAFLTNQLPYPERLGWPRMWSECAEQLRVAHDDVERARKIKRSWSLWVRGQSTFVVEKSISNALRIRFLEENFKNAKFIHIVRNGYAVSAGIRRKANLVRWRNPKGLQSYPIEMCARQWSESINVVDSEIDRGAPIITVRYEEIAANPVGALQPVFEFLGVEPISDKSVWGKMRVHEKSSTIKDMNQRSISSLSNDDMRKIDSIADANLIRLGYK